MAKAGRARGYRKFDNTRIERTERFHRRGRCYLTVAAFTGELHCGTHGRAAGWPCALGHHSELTFFPGVTATQVVASHRAVYATWNPDAALQMDMGFV